jgi:hypothetical protein
MYHLITNNKNVCEIICNSKNNAPDGYRLDYKSIPQLVDAIKFILENSNEKETSFTIFSDMES